MEQEKLKSGKIKLIAKEGYIIKSKSTHFDEEKGQEVPDVEGTLIYLGINDKAENYKAEKVEEGV